jgi:hypothetical protein
VTNLVREAQAIGSGKVNVLPLEPLQLLLSCAVWSYAFSVCVCVRVRACVCLCVCLCVPAVIVVYA